MTYQEYLRKINKLTTQKDALYSIVDRKLSQGNKTGARHMYLEIDEVQAELNKLENPEDKIATEEEITLKFNS